MGKFRYLAFDFKEKSEVVKNDKYKEDLAKAGDDCFGEE